MDTKRIDKKLIILLGLYCLLRLPLLLSPLEDVTYEIYRGAIAHDLIHGLKLSFWDYAADPYGLGPLLNGFWTVPFFLLFGENWFALKFAPFAWHFLTVFVWYYVWKDYYVPQKAFLISLFFILAPSTIIEYSLTNSGYHFEMVLWMGLTLLLLRRVLAGTFWLGMLGGFSSAMVLTNLVTVATVLFYLKNSRLYLFYLVGFCVGFSPLVFFNTGSNWGEANFAYFAYTLFTIEASIPSWIINGKELLTQGLPALFGFGKLPQPLAWLFSFLFTGLYLLSLIHLTIRKPKLPIESFGLLFQVLLLVCAVLASNGTRPYYLFPLVPFVGMNLALLLESLRKEFQYSLLSFCFIGGLIGNLSLLQPARFGESFSMPGYSKMDGLVWTLENRFGHDLKLFWEKSRIVLANESLDFKKEFYGSLSGELFKIKSEEDLKQALSFIEELEPELRPPLLERLEMALKRYRLERK